MRRLRIEADSKDKAADPSEDLRVSVALDPCGGKAAKSVMRADRHEVRKSKQCAGQRHEEKTAQDPDSQRQALLTLAQGDCLRGSCFRISLT